MKATLLTTLLIGALLAPVTLLSQDYSYFIRQVQFSDLAEYDVDVTQKGQRLSELPINPEGARFELWTVKADPLTSYLVDTTYVNSYIPVAEVTITSEDPYELIPRTRCDRPFTVTMNIQGLSTDPAAPEAAKSVKILRHVQPYQNKGTGKNTDRGNASLISQASLDSNGTYTFEYSVTSIPSGDPTKVRGEERFSVYSLQDYQAPESQLDALFIQVWPMAECDLTGIDSNTTVRGFAPDVSVNLVDLYPDSWTYAQVYRGNPQLGKNGILVPGSSIVIDGTVPRDEVLTLTDWDSVLNRDGTWTMEIITVTPFGADRLAYTTFDVDRTLKVNGAVTSVE